MKNLILTLTAVAIALGTFSCKKFVSGQDKSPNSPSEATTPLLLSACEVAVFATYGGSISRTTSMWAQQSSGCQNQSHDVDQYVLDEGDVVNEWQTAYSALKNMKKLNDKAGAENPHYQGIGNVMTALMLGVTTDLWGDIPWSDALKGEDQHFSAAYDNQEDVIKAIQKLLDDGITKLKTPGSANIIEPGPDDYIYQGDVQKWTAFAYLIKARYAMRISKRDNNWYTNALKFADSAMANGLNSSSADANCIFGTNANEYNQWYAFVKVSRGGYMYASKSFTDTMNSINDPRTPMYFTLNDSGKYEGSALGTYNTDNVSEIGDFFASPNSVTPLGTYVELLFIQAEAYLAGGDKSNAAKAYNDAVKAHVMQITGAPAPAGYISSQANANAGNINQSQIMFQKYIACYTMIEPYNDWRRTNVPSLKPNPDAAITGIARRYPSSIDERLYNTQSAGHIHGKQELATAKVWWDN